MQSNDRIALSKLKKENFTLKRKIEELETDQELSQLDESLFSSQESEERNIAAAKDVCPDEKDSAKAPDDKLITSDSGKTADLNPSTSGSTQFCHLIGFFQPCHVNSDPLFSEFCLFSESCLLSY
jgi:hypothetical protein